MEKEKILKAGKITREVREWIKPQIKKGRSLLEIAEKIESKILELGGKPAFPVNLSIDEIAAHYTPSHNDTGTARGLLKVDFGVHIDGWAADNAFTLDMEDDEENKNLIKASSEALKEALDAFGKGKEIKNIGRIVSEKIESHGFAPVVNLSGHSMDQWELHSGVTIPNVDNGNSWSIEKGLYAIEPFATTGNGKVKEGNPSGIYQLQEENRPRSPFARGVLQFIKDEYGTLPFCSRWIVKEFGTRALLSLKELEKNGSLHQFEHLIEVSGGKVAQTEQTIFIDEKGEKIITTL